MSVLFSSYEDINSLFLLAIHVVNAGGDIGLSTGNGPLAAVVVQRAKEQGKLDGFRAEICEWSL
jgi:hypothetical protein